MNKDIRKNREALVRYLYSSKNTTSNYKFQCACVKHNIFYCFNLPHEKLRYRFGDTPKYDPKLNNLLGMDEGLYHETEQRYEGFYPFQVGERKSMHEIADWLQALPGWPRVL